MEELSITLNSSSLHHVSVVILFPEITIVSPLHISKVSSGTKFVSQEIKFIEIVS